MAAVRTRTRPSGPQLHHAHHQLRHPPASAPVAQEERGADGMPLPDNQQTSGEWCRSKRGRRTLSCTKRRRSRRRNPSTGLECYRRGAVDASQHVAATRPRGHLWTCLTLSNGVCRVASIVRFPQLDGRPSGLQHQASGFVKGKSWARRLRLSPRTSWALRGRLQMENLVSELALFELRIDSQLRDCDHTSA